MNYEQAKQKILNVPWKMDVCHSGENCWCRVIRPAEQVKYDESAVLDCVIDWGSVDEKTAEYIIDLHNNFIEQKTTTFHKPQNSFNLKNYEEARCYSLSIPWKLSVCGAGEECWCRVVMPTEKIEYIHKYSNGKETTHEIEDIVPDGAVDKDIAEYIVNLHNKSIQDSTVSKPGAVLEVSAVPIPERVQAKITEAIRGK